MFKLFRNKYRGINDRDIFVSSFPKTGSTYTRFVLANTINLLNKSELAVDFYSLGKIVPEISKDDLLSFTNEQFEIPRFIKTHEYFSRKHTVYSKQKVIYIIRDPRDTMISYFNYASKRKKNRFTGTFIDFVNAPDLGINAYNRHVEEWLPESDWIFKYEDLMTDSFALFKQLFSDIKNGGIDDELLKKAIHLSSPNRLKKVEEEKSRPNAKHNFDDDFKFVRNASIEQWKSELSKEDADYIFNKSSNILKLTYSG